MCLLSVYRIKLRIAPTDTATIIIIKADFNISFIPNSRVNTTNVAIQGKYIAKIVEPITNCLVVKLSGPSIPTATSFLKKPTIKAEIASLGSPHKPVKTGQRDKQTNL